MVCAQVFVGPFRGGCTRFGAGGTPSAGRCSAMRGLSIEWFNERLAADVWHFVETEMNQPADQVRALFDWLFQDVTGQRPLSIVIAHVRGRVLGILGCIHSLTVLKGRAVDAWALSHFLVAKAYQSLGIGGYMLRWLEENSEGRLLFAYGYGGLGVQALYEKQWTVLPGASFPSYFFLDDLGLGGRFLTRAAQKARRLAPLAANRFIRGAIDFAASAARRLSQRAPRPSMRPVTTYGEDWQALAASVAGQYTFTTMRDQDWMRRRLGHAPWAYEFWELRSDGALQGAAITRSIDSIRSFPGRTARVIVDMISSPQRPDVIRRLLGAIVGASKYEGHAVVVANFSHARFRVCLRATGFWDLPVLSTYLQLRLPMAFHAPSSIPVSSLTEGGLAAMHISLADGDTETWYVV